MQRSASQLFCLAAGPALLLVAARQLQPSRCRLGYYLPASPLGQHNADSFMILQVLCASQYRHRALCVRAQQAAVESVES